MSMAQYGSLLILTKDEREELAGWAQSRTLPAGDVLRAQLILALADGWSYREIEQKLNTSAPTIASDDPEVDSKAADIIGRT
jgi:Trp operon repressor